MARPDDGDDCWRKKAGSLSTFSGVIDCGGMRESSFKNTSLSSTSRRTWLPVASNAVVAARVGVVFVGSSFGVVVVGINLGVEMFSVEKKSLHESPSVLDWLDCRCKEGNFGRSPQLLWLFLL